MNLVLEILLVSAALFVSLGYLSGKGIEARDAKRFDVEQTVWELHPNDLTAELVEGFNLRQIRELSLAYGYVQDLAAFSAAEKPAEKPPADQPFDLPDDELIGLPSGEYIRFGDIPRLASGEVDPAWLAKNCPCPDHMAKAENLPDTPPSEWNNGGMYL